LKYIVAGILIAIIILQRFFSGELDLIRLLKFCLVLTVASIPVAMPGVIGQYVGRSAKFSQKECGGYPFVGDRRIIGYGYALFR
jgi:hypothetical protein